MNDIKIEKKGKDPEYMGLDTFSRWMCLVEAFFFIEQKGEELGLPDVSSLIKPLAIEKYIDERYASMRHDVEMEYILGNI